MIGNLFFFALISGLALLCAWLTWRAVRARRLWVKIGGGLGAGLPALLLGAIAFFGGKGLLALYFPGAPPAPDLAVAGTPEQIARGEYLVNISCVGCHGALDADGRPGDAPPLSGGYNLSAAEGFGFIGDLIAENLTPGGKMAGYSDGEIFRALRHGVSKDGRMLVMMSFLSYNQLSDADTQAIIAFLRSQPRVEPAGATGDNMNFIGAAMLGAGMFGPEREPAPASIAAPPEGVTPEYGRYVATFGDCRGCHGPNVTGTAATSVSPAIPNPRPLVAALSQEEFIAMMRSGVRPGNKPFPETMPWQSAARMSDADLAALYAYLSAPAE